eukprot:scaffold2378_cov424-Prasinococcus_capsulatus_cf.AAC.1
MRYRSVTVLVTSQAVFHVSSNKRITGCALVENVEEARQMPDEPVLAHQPCNEFDTGLHTRQEGTSAASKLTKVPTVPVALGVKVVWVHQSVVNAELSAKRNSVQADRGGAEVHVSWVCRASRQACVFAAHFGRSPPDCDILWLQPDPDIRWLTAPSVRPPSASTSLRPLVSDSARAQVLTANKHEHCLLPAASSVITPACVRVWSTGVPTGALIWLRVLRSTGVLLAIPPS